MAVLKTIPGHDVRVAANAAKAIEHAAGLGGVDLLVTDVVMDPTDGFTLRDELRASYPEMQTIFVSGYDLSEYVERLEGSLLLAKPVDVAEFRAVVAKALGESPAVAEPPAPVVAQPVVVEPVVAQPVVVEPEPAVTPNAVAPHPPSVPVAPEISWARTTPVAQPQAVAPAPAKEVSRPTGAKPATVPSAPVARAVPQVPAGAGAAPQVAKPVPVVPPSAVPAVPVAKVVPATPVAVPKSGPAPGVSKPAIPAAAPFANPAAGAPVSVPVPATSAEPADPLIGVQLGDYRVQQLLGRGIWGKVYAATQLSVNRRVGLNVLDPERAQEEQNRAQFLADARAKAAVQHPLIMSVFEVDERNGLVFYTHESLDGASMQERIDRGQYLDEKTAFQVVKAAGEALHYLWSHNLSHGPISASAIRVGNDQIARVENLATAGVDNSVTVEGEIDTVGKIIQRLVPEKSLSGGFRALLGRMTGGAPAVTSWPLVLQAVKALEPKVIPVEAAKIKAADAAAMRAQEAARSTRKKNLYFSIASLALLIVALSAVAWKFLISNARKLDVQVLIPAGNYLVGNPGAQVSLGAYEIDKYEVTINEYAKFIAWCEKNPEREHEFDHQRGDRKASHVNDEVKILISNALVRGKRVFKQDADPSRKIAADPGVEVDLNSPMVAVTFWDAYAYAHWRGKILENGSVRDLPTEEEWEAAARGPKGYKYPWGDEMKLKNFNSNQGYQSLAPGGAKTEDGFNYWSPVDAFSGDESDLKVVGMAGNVTEWVYRKEAQREIPLLKGGSFASPPVEMWGRILKIPADDAWFVYPASMKPKGQARPLLNATKYYVDDDVGASVRSLYIGFRTVKRK